MIEQYLQALRNQTVAIGRDPQTRQLLVSAGNKMTRLGAVNSVPQSVSRNKLNEGSAHCKLSVDVAGKLFIENGNANNVTYVDGNQVFKKALKGTERISLGKEMYPIRLPDILKAAVALLGIKPPPPPAEKVDIRHLKAVWETYEKGMEELDKHQRQMNALSKLSPILLIGVGVVGSIGFKSGVPGAIAFVLAIVSFVLTCKDRTPQKKKQLQYNLQRDYVCRCDKEKCKKFIGNTPYDLLPDKCPMGKNKMFVK